MMALIADCHSVCTSVAWIADCESVFTTVARIADCEVSLYARRWL